MRAGAPCGRDGQAGRRRVWRLRAPPQQLQPLHPAARGRRGARSDGPRIRRTLPRARARAAQAISTLNEIANVDLIYADSTIDMPEPDPTIKHARKAARLPPWLRSIARPIARPLSTLRRQAEAAGRCAGGGGQAVLNGAKGAAQKVLSIVPTNQRRAAHNPAGAFDVGDAIGEVLHGCAMQLAKARVALVALVAASLRAAADPLELLKSAGDDAMRALQQQVFQGPGDVQRHPWGAGRAGPGAAAGDDAISDADARRLLETLLSPARPVDGDSSAAPVFATVFDDVGPAEPGEKAFRVTRTGTVTSVEATVAPASIEASGLLPLPKQQRRRRWLRGRGEKLPSADASAVAEPTGGTDPSSTGAEEMEQIAGGPRAPQPSSQRDANARSGSGDSGTPALSQSHGHGHRALVSARTAGGVPAEVVIPAGRVKELLAKYAESVNAATPHAVRAAALSKSRGSSAAVEAKIVIKSARKGHGGFVQSASLSIVPTADRASSAFRSRTNAEAVVVQVRKILSRGGDAVAVPALTGPLDPMEALGRSEMSLALPSEHLLAQPLAASMLVSLLGSGAGIGQLRGSGSLESPTRLPLQPMGVPSDEGPALTSPVSAALVPALAPRRILHTAQASSAGERSEEVSGTTPFRPLGAAALLGTPSAAAAVRPRGVLRISSFPSPTGASATASLLEAAGDEMGRSVLAAQPIPRTYFGMRKRVYADPSDLENLDPNKASSADDAKQSRGMQPRRAAEAPVDASAAAGPVYVNSAEAVSVVSGSCVADSEDDSELEHDAESHLMGAPAELTAPKTASKAGAALATKSGRKSKKKRGLFARMCVCGKPSADADSDD